MKIMGETFVVFSLLLLPVILFFIPLSWVEQQKAVCFFKNVFGFECFGCGTTRAVISAVQLNFEKAVGYNWKIVFVFPLLCWVWFKLVFSNVLISKGKFPAACGEKNKVIPETIPRCLRRGVSSLKKELGLWLKKKK